MKLIYIAGPYRTSTEYGVKCNIYQAEQAALFVWRHGGAAICPHKNTAFFGGACPDEVWLEGDLEIMRRCDGVYALEEWEQSKGAYKEVAEARRLGLPVFFRLTHEGLLMEFLEK